MKTRILLIVMLAIVGLNTMGQTNISGFINANTTWDIGGSPYIITGNALVSQGFTLTINPGVIVKFNSPKALQIDGELIAIGNPQNRISFISNLSTPQAGDWSEMHFSSTCVSATFDGNGNYLSGSIMKYCDVLYGGGLGNGEIHIESSSPYFSHWNTANSSNDGIYCNGSSYLIDSSIVKNCTGIGLHFNNISLTSCGLTIIGDSIVSNSGGGVIVTNSTLTCQPIIKKNYFYGNLQKGALTVGGPNLEVTENTFINNTITSNGAVVNVNGGNTTKNYFENNTANAGRCILSSGGLISCNKFVSNHVNDHGIIYLPYGGSIIDHNIFDSNFGYSVVVSEIEGGSASSITFSNNTIRNNSVTSGVCCKFNMDLYGGSFMNINNNNFINNVAIDVVNFSIMNNSTSPFLNMTNNNFSNPMSQYEFYNNIAYGLPNLHLDSNYWGTTSTQHIDSVIFDYFDDATKSVVYYTPILTSPVSVDTSCASSSELGIPFINKQSTSQIYPNPFSTQAILTLQGTYNNPSLFIYNLLGQEVRSIPVGTSKEVTIPRSNLPAGMYFYKLIDENKEVIGIGKLLVE